MHARLNALADVALAVLVRCGFAFLRWLGPNTGPPIGAWIARNLGPLTPTHRIARDNIAAAFPEKTAPERRRIAVEAWDNLGRTACEYVHLDALWDFNEADPGAGRIEASEAVMARYAALAADRRGALIFAAHLANWELPAVAAARHGLAAAVLYRTPNNPRVASDILALRAGSMGTLIAAGVAAPIRMMEALEAGLHVGMLIDQRFGRGPKVPFLGRPAYSNPLLARLARRFPDLPVHGARAVRLSGGRFRLELTEAITLPRTPDGRIDVDAATALLNAIVSDWVREYPGQWLWMHRRWR